MPGRRRDGGFVTVEAAISLGALTAVLAMLMAGIGALSGHIRCLDAAREAARLTAAGQPGAADAVVQTIAPHGAKLSLRRSSDGITAEVTTDALAGFLPGIHLGGTAFAIAEPGTDPADQPVSVPPPSPLTPPTDPPATPPSNSRATPPSDGSTGQGGPT
ncbi:TadE family type IV pilus minor pilin [Amycolatopsis sp. NBC_01480]|uniref:TadE family type IV pilus minor pilin n=1 Tax=Amycolatopsis sp. NBC_01480 TaxID=2903562 RepID=UPI002E2E67A1|nr:TadE family type IV pilus minor pilin [Amycolatopsis sp. NBC_01480]